MSEQPKMTPYDILMAASVDEAEAQRLAETYVAEGWEQTSNKYRSIARVPPGETALAALERVSPSEARHLRERLECLAADTYRRVYAQREGNQRDLDLRTFQAFKRLKVAP